MNEELFSDIAIEQAAARKFKVALDVKQMILRDVPVGRIASASVFITSHNHMYVFIRAQAPIILDDVRKIINRMGLQADVFLPPDGNKDYFNDIGRERFRAVFPGRTPGNDEDLHYYRLLAPYNPALVRISAVKTGVIRQFDLDSTQWRTAKHFSYRKVTV